MEERAVELGIPSEEYLRDETLSRPRQIAKYFAGIFFLALISNTVAGIYFVAQPMLDERTDSFALWIYTYFMFVCFMVEVVGRTTTRYAKFVYAISVFGFGSYMFSAVFVFEDDGSGSLSGSDLAAWSYVYISSLVLWLLVCILFFSWLLCVQDDDEDDESS